MMDLKIGWAIADVGVRAGTRILRTVDGGATWRDLSPADNSLSGAFFLNAKLAWSWSAASAWRTQDGGLSWTRLGDVGVQPDIWFNDSQHGWKLNADVWGLSYRQFDIVSFSVTEDGGETWRSITPPPDRGVAFMAYPGPQMAWVVRAGFANTIEGVPNLSLPIRIQMTRDGGHTWITQEMPLAPEAIRVERLNEGEYLGEVGNCEIISPVYSSTAIWKVALTCERWSWLYTSANQGQTWVINSIPAGIDGHIQFVTPAIGWLFQGGWSRDYHGDLYQTIDGGQTWTLIKHTGWGDVRLSFIDAQAGVAIACSQGYCANSNTAQELMLTTNGGLTWQYLKPQLEP